MLSPSPLKAPPRLSAAPACFPKEVGVQDHRVAKPVWYDDDEATRDLREVMSLKTPTKVAALEARSLSAASTCSPSPTLSVPTPSSTPGCAFVQPDLGNGRDSPTRAQTPQCPPGALDKSSWLQARKVFVGGIPQTIDQNGLYQMFSKMGEIKKAWLQSLRSPDQSSAKPAGASEKSNKHRGFGFVIFCEKKAIDAMLGEDFSRFVYFENDLKLEVKRAVKPQGPDEQFPTAKTKNPESSSSKMPTASSPASHAAPAARRSCPNQALPNERPSTSSPVSPAPSQIRQAAALQTQQSGPGQIMMVGFPYSSGNLPFVPPLPQAAGPPIAQRPAVRNPSRATSSSQAVALQPTVAPQSYDRRFLFGILLDGFVGPIPTNNQDLQRVLLQAMPDHYDD